MRFLVDECTGPAVAQWLRAQAHDVFSVYDEARGLDDERIFQVLSQLFLTYPNQLAGQFVVVTE